MSWWKNLCRRNPDSDLDAELRYHIDRRIDDHRNAGLSPAEARRRVRLELGDVAALEDDCRDVRPLAWLTDLVRDARLGFRSLGREPLFCASVIAILACGLGATITMFSVLNAVVLRPLPYPNAGELATLRTHDITRNQWDGTSPPNFLDWRRQSRGFAGMTCYRRTQVSQVEFAGLDAAQRAQEGLVGPGFFDVIGAAPLLGRTFTAEEFERGERLVVLSEGLWKEQFARSSSALGRTLSVAGAEHTIIGVMPASFHLPTNDTRLWRPITVLAPWEKFAGSPRAGDAIEVLGRLAPGASIEDARAEMAVVAQRLRDEHVENRNLDIRVTPLFEHVVGARTSKGVWIGFAAVLSLLAIVCANVGGLLAARAVRRRRELAVRVALGAGRLRLIRQLLAEAGSLWAVASAAGAFIAYFSIQLLLAYGPRALPRLDQAALDLPALAIALLAGLVVVTLAAAVPAILASRTGGSLAFGARERSSLPRPRFQDALVTAQIAGALVLLVCSVLLARSFLRAQAEDPGFPAQTLLVIHIDRTSVQDFFREAQQRIGRLPGVVAVGGVKQFFLRRNPDQSVRIEGGEPASREGEPKPKLAGDAVTPGYFSSMDIQLIEGRDFDDRDLEPDARVSIVNQTMARRFWPGESAIGKRWSAPDAPLEEGSWNTVVGVVEDMRREGLDVAPIAAVFVPDVFSRDFDLTVRASAGAAALIPALRQELRSIDASMAVPTVATADSLLAERLGERRFETQLLGAFAAIALLLSAAGLYASLAYQVVLRTKEIGIRSALGAQRHSLTAMVLKKGIRLAALGCILGVLAATAAGRVLESLLYETEALDPASYALAIAFVLALAAAAGWAPARRAAGVDPLTALRQD